jgi:hypothetical protein
MAAADDEGDVARLRRELGRLAQRVAVVEGELRAVQRRAASVPIAAHQAVRRAEAAALLDVKPATLAAWARDGRGPPFHIRGKAAWYRLADLAAWREAAEQAAPVGPRAPPPPAKPPADVVPLLPGL